MFKEKTSMVAATGGFNESVGGDKTGSTRGRQLTVPRW